MIQAVFLDFDGVILDSRRAIGRCFDEVLLQRGLAPLDEDELMAVIGPPLTEGFATALARRGASHRVESCVREFRRRYAAVSLEATTLQPGMLTALHELVDRVPLALVTSKLRSLTEPLLERFRLDQLFRVVAAPTDDRDGEPKSETLREAVGRLNTILYTPFDASAAVMVGDRRHDVVAGKALAMKTVGVAWGCGSLDELRSAGADFIVSEPRALASDLLGTSKEPL